MDYLLAWCSCALPGSADACCERMPPLRPRGGCRYVVYFKCNRQCIHQFPNLARLTRDIYHTPGARLLT